MSIGGFLAEAARLAVEKPETAIYSYFGYAISNLISVESWVALKPNLWWSHAVVSLIFIAIIPTTKMFHAIAVVVNVGLTNRKLRGHLRPMNVTALMEDEDMNEDEISLGVGNHRTSPGNNYWIQWPVQNVPGVQQYALRTPVGNFCPP